MPTKGKKRTSRKISAPEVVETYPAIELSEPIPSTTIFTKKYTLLVLILVFLLVLGYLNKSWFVAAVVNGRPITRIALDQALTKQYGAQTLDNMINEDLINQEIAKQNVSISQSELDQKVAEITAGLPQGVTLDQALQLQGMDAADFKNQVKIQLGIDKILAAQISVSDKEVSQYIATNAAQFKDASPSAAQASARNILVRQKENDAFTTWFAAIKQNAKVAKFL